MASKKIVFVIVEGPSDDEALGVLLEKIFDRNTVYVHIAYGDITTQSSGSTIVSDVGNIVKGYAEKNSHLKSTDFLKIIHIVDTDGAYIPDYAVTEKSDAEKPVYSPANIQYKNVDGIRKRNSKKRSCIDRLLDCEKIWKVPYQLYYMSCNLDHVLYNELNLSDEEKEDYSYRFAKKYRNHVDDFITFIVDSDFSVTDDYINSWDYIRTGLHSLERHSNLGICLLKARSDST